jgi:hypothetical protein
MSSSSPSAWMCLINPVGSCYLALVIALVFIARASAVPLPDANSIFNHQSQSKQLLWESTRNSKKIGIILINWAIMGLKAAALLALLCLTTLGLSTVTRDFYSRWLMLL